MMNAQTEQNTDGAPETGLERIDPSWLSSWGHTIKSPDLRSMIEATPRLAGRIREQIFREAQAVVLDGRPEPQRRPKIEDRIIATFMQTPSQDLIRKVGVAWHANTVKKLLNGDGAKDLLGTMGQEPVRYALSYQSLAPEFETDFTQEEFMARMGADGHAVILEWIKHFPNPAALPMLTTIPKPNEKAESLPEKYHETAITLVNGVLRSGGQPLQQ